MLLSYNLKVVVDNHTNYRLKLIKKAYQGLEKRGKEFPPLPVSSPPPIIPPVVVKDHLGFGLSSIQLSSHLTGREPRASNSNERGTNI